MTETTSTRNAKCTKTYITADGKRLSKSADTIIGVEFAFADPGDIFTIFAAEPTEGAREAARGQGFGPGDFPASYQTAAAVRGWAEDLGNAYAGVKSVEEAQTKFVNMLNSRLEGDWSEPKGPQEATGDILEAVVAFCVKNGKDAEKSRAVYVERLYSRDAEGKLTSEAKTLRKQLVDEGNPKMAGIVAEYKRIKAERAQAAVKAADKKAKDAGDAADVLDAVA